MTKKELVLRELNSALRDCEDPDENNDEIFFLENLIDQLDEEGGVEKVLEKLSGGEGDDYPSWSYFNNNEASGNMWTTVDMMKYACEILDE